MTSPNESSNGVNPDQPLIEVLKGISNFLESIDQREKARQNNGSSITTTGHNVSQSNDSGESTAVLNGGAHPSVGQASTSLRHNNEVADPKTIITFFNGFFKSIIAVSTFGCSVTFSLMISRPEGPHEGQFGHQTTQKFLNTSWLLFLIALGTCGFLAAWLTFSETYIERMWAKKGGSKTKNGDPGYRESRGLRFLGTLASVIPFALVIGAFMLLSLMVTAYTKTVGWAAVIFTGVYGFVGLTVMLVQSPFLGDCIQWCFCCCFCQRSTG